MLTRIFAAPRAVYGFSAMAFLLASSLTTASPPDDEALQEYVVTATRTRVLANELAASVAIVSRRDIERSLAGDAAALLSQQTGLEVARNGGPGQLASLFTRGTNSDHTLVLVDGVRINPGTLGGAALQNLAPEGIERIEIVKGPRSTLYGTDAIGGVVNVTTRAAANNGFNLMAAAGRYGTRQWSLGGGHDFGNDSRLGFSVGRLESDGFAPLLSSTEARGFNNATANLHGRIAASKRLTLRAQAWRASGRAEYLDFFASPLAQDFENSAYDLAADFRASDRWQARFGLSAALDETAQIESDDFVRTRRRGVDLQSDWQLSEHLQLTAGALLTRETIDAQVFGSPIDADVNVEQGFGELQYVRGRQRWSGAAAYVDHPSFGGHGVWNAEYVLGFGRGSRLLLAAGSAFRAPDASERFGFGGNPQLEPERSRQVEVGLRQQLGARHEWQLAAYRNEISDLINYVITDFVTFDGRNENVDRALIEGVELTYRYRGENWSLRAGASFNNPRDRGTDRRLLRRAREQFLLAAVKRWNRWEISADAQWQGERLDFGFPSPTVLGSYTLLNLGASLAVTNDWSLQLKLDNALDERYELVSGYRTARRGLTLATRYRFR